MSSKRGWSLQIAGGLGGALVMAFAPDVAPDAWKLPLVLVGLAMFSVSLYPRLRAFCEWMQHHKRGPVTLLFIGVLMIVAGGYIAYKGANGTRLASVLRVAKTPEPNVSPAYGKLAPEAIAPTSKDGTVGGRATDEPGTTIGPMAAVEAIQALKELQASPPPRQQVQPSPPRLKRLIAYEAPALIPSATQGDDGAKHSVRLANMAIRNVGDETIEIWVTYNLKVGDRPILTYRPGPATLVQQTQAANFPGQPLDVWFPAEAAAITGDVEVKYDTVPPTGPRISGRAFTFPVTFPNGRAAAAVVGAPVITKHWER